MKQKTGNTKIVIAYMRCSTDVERQALGVEAQRQAIESWAAKEGVGVVGWYTEEISGGAPLDKRLTLLEALAAVGTHKAGRLVVHRLDRFSRDPLTAALAETELRRHGATLACADGAGGGQDPTAELVRGILLSVAKFERAMIRARVASAMQVKKRRGEICGEAPFGFRRGDDGKMLVADENEQATLATLRELRASGVTIRGLEAAAVERGLVGRAGRPLTKTSIHNILSHVRAETAVGGMS